MVKGYEVLQYLIPNGGWYISGDDYQGIKFLECEPISKEEFEAGFAKTDAWKKEQAALNAAKKEAAQAKLTALGLTADDIKALGL